MFLINMKHLVVLVALLAVTSAQIKTAIMEDDDQNRAISSPADSDEDTIGKYLMKNSLKKANQTLSVIEFAVEAIPQAYITWRAGTSNRVVVPAHQAGNRFLGSLKGLQIRALCGKFFKQLSRSGICSYPKVY